jgi:cytochrome oxidase Cu insertion factor (SCO1/SenC/PrrC family)
MLCITIVLTFIVISAIGAEENQMETFKDLKVGMAAPDFTLNDGNGAAHNLRDYLGEKNVVLAFYPKDFTGG